VLTTYRLTEHSGIMTRYVRGWRSCSRPCSSKSIRNSRSSRASRTALGNDQYARRRDRSAGTRQRAHAPLRLGRGQYIHQIGIPYNYGTLGYTSATSWRSRSAGDGPNVSIHEAKTITCTIRPAGVRRTSRRRKTRTVRCRPGSIRRGSIRRARDRQRRPPAASVRMMMYGNGSSPIPRFASLQSLRSRVQTVESAAGRRLRVHRKLLR